MSYAAEGQTAYGGSGRSPWKRERGAPMFRNGLEIAATIMGFVFYWPVGLALVFFFAWRKREGFHFGDRFGFSAARDRGFDMFRNSGFGAGNFGMGAFGMGSGNAAFDEYRVAVLKRLEEERRKLDEEQMAFRAFVERLRKAKDQDEFDRFMRDRSAGPDEKPAA